MQPTDFEKLGLDIRASPAGSVFVVTSRRTDEAGVRALKESLGVHPTVNAFVDDPRLDYRFLLGTADRLMVTGESLSMISEACGTEKQVSLYDFGGKLSRHPLYPLVEDWAREGLIALYPHWPEPGRKEPLNEGRYLARQILPRL